MTALYAVGSAQPAVLARKTRFTIGLAVISYVVANGVLLLGSKQLLGLFGPSYAEQGIWSMRLLGLGAFPFFIKELYVTICRIQDRIAKVLLPLAAGGLLELGLAALGAHLAGVSGLSLGWDIAVCIQALCMAPTVYKIARSTAISTAKDQRQPYPPSYNEAYAIDTYDAYANEAGVR